MKKGRLIEFVEFIGFVGFNELGKTVGCGWSVDDRLWTVRLQVKTGLF